MKLKFLITLAIVLIAVPVIAADAPEPITVAVFDFGSPNKGSFIEQNISVATTLINANLGTNPAFSLVERAELKKILGEQALGVSGLVQPDSAARIGQLTGAKVLVTGQLMLVSESEDLNARTMLLVANVIGTETGRVFSQKVQGTRSDEVALVTTLSEKIAQTITSQRTNLIAEPALGRDQRISQMIAKIEGKKRPAVSFAIDEHIFGATNNTLTVSTELGYIFQKAGFEVVDANSDKSPDVLITGNAAATRTQRKGGFFTCQGTLEIKAQARTNGEILTLDRQEAVVADPGKTAAAKDALVNASDDLAERLLVLLAR